VEERRFVKSRFDDRIAQQRINRGAGIEGIKCLPVILRLGDYRYVRR
jgi:hypothetical protein